MLQASPPLAICPQNLSLSDFMLAALLSLSLISVPKTPLSHTVISTSFSQTSCSSPTAFLSCDSNLGSSLYDMAEFIRYNYVTEVIEYLQSLSNFNIRNKPFYKDIDAETEAPIL